MKVSGEFFAEGGEKFLTIGCFRRDSEDNIQQISNNPTTSINWSVAAYYIDAVVLQEDNSIGISEREAFSVSVFPNPAKENLTIQSKTPLAQVWLTDLTGRRFAAFQSHGQQWQLNVSGFSSGIYLVEAKTENGTRSVQKVVVQ